MKVGYSRRELVSYSMAGNIHDKVFGLDFTVRATPYPITDPDCLVCEKTFIVSSFMDKHEITHTDKKKNVMQVERTV